MGWCWGERLKRSGAQGREAGVVQEGRLEGGENNWTQERVFEEGWKGK